MNKGFTLLETIVTIAVVGTLSSIAAVSWSRFVESKQVGTIAEKAFIALRSTQSEANQQRLEKFIQFRQNEGQIEYSTYSKGALPQVWENIGEAKFHSENDFTQISFDFKGNVNFPDTIDEFPTLAFTDPNDRHVACVQIRTLLGAMSIEHDSDCTP